MFLRGLEIDASILPHSFNEITKVFEHDIVFNLEDIQQLSSMEPLPPAHKEKNKNTTLNSSLGGSWPGWLGT